MNFELFNWHGRISAVPLFIIIRLYTFHDSRAVNQMSRDSLQHSNPLSMGTNGDVILLKNLFLILYHISANFFFY